MEKVRMRQVTRTGSKGFIYKTWKATYKGHTAYATCPIWAYCEVREKARRGF